MTRDSIIFRNVTVVSSSYFGTGMSKVKIEGLNCTGDETHIAACNFTGWGINEFYSGFNTDSPHILHMKLILW
jgi:hypothetical protein